MKCRTDRLNAVQLERGCSVWKFNLNIGYYPEFQFSASVPRTPSLLSLHPMWIILVGPIFSCSPWIELEVNWVSSPQTEKNLVYSLRQFKASEWSQFSSIRPPQSSNTLLSSKQLPSKATVLYILLLLEGLLWKSIPGTCKGRDYLPLKICNGASAQRPFGNWLENSILSQAGFWRFLFSYLAGNPSGYLMLK